MNIITQPTSTPKLCHQCAAATTGSTQAGKPICLQCATAAVKEIIQYGGGK